MKNAKKRAKKGEKRGTAEILYPVADKLCPVFLEYISPRSCP